MATVRALCAADAGGLCLQLSSASACALREQQFPHSLPLTADSPSCTPPCPSVCPGLVDIIVWEAVRSDYFSMIIHHISTLSLLFGSFYFG